MKMSKGHFEMLAQVLRVNYFALPLNTPSNTYEYGAAAMWRQIRSDLAKELKRTNPNFDSDRFMDACLPKKVTQ